jgi:hypothetical protein
VRCEVGGKVNEEAGEDGEEHGKKTSYECFEQWGNGVNICCKGNLFISNIDVTTLLGLLDSARPRRLQYPSRILRCCTY